MVRMFVRHLVKDFAAWKQAYDAFDDERKGLGVIGEAVFQKIGSPNDVTLWHDFDSLEAAEAFIVHPRLKEVMDEAGVASAPDIWCTTQD